MTLRVHDAVTVSVHPPTAGLLAQVGGLAAVAGTVGLGVAGWLAGLAYALAMWATLTGALRRPGARPWGPADTVTLTRATLVVAVTALVADAFWAATPVGLLVALAAVALSLDAVDGQVARRTGTASPLGARFDMETDSVLVLVLTVFLVPVLGWWVLLIGGFRYAFGAAAWLLPWLQASLPPRMSRKAVAAAQGIVLVVAASGLLPVVVTAAVVGAALASLCWSFGSDVVWLWRRRPPVPVPERQAQQPRRYPAAGRVWAVETQ